MKSLPWLKACIVDGILCAGTFLESCHVNRVVKPWGNWRTSNLHMAPLLHLPANPTSHAGCLIVRWRETAFECEWLVQQRLQKLCKILEVKCMKTRVAVIFVVQLLWILSVIKVVALIPGFSKKLPLLKCICLLYWPNTRGNLNRPVLRKVPFRQKRARVVKGMNARWSVELISAYLVASFAPCKGIWILESGKFLLVESIWYPLNFCCETLNPGLRNVKYSSWNPKSP